MSQEEPQAYTEMPITEISHINDKNGTGKAIFAIWWTE